MSRRHVHAPRWALLAGAAGLAWGCGSNNVPGPPTELSDALPYGVECIDLCVNGPMTELLFAWADEDGNKEVHHTRSRDNGQTWTGPVRVDMGVPPLGGHHVQMWSGPQIAGRGDNLMALWTSEGTGFMARGPLAISISRDGGQTWTPGRVPVISAEDGAQAFPDLVVDSSGVFHAIWLERMPEMESKSLVYSSVGGVEQAWSTPTVADEAVCECCWNRLALGPGGALYALYRDINPRDMSIATLKAGTRDWVWLGHTGAFDWDIQACPHVGGGLLPQGGTAGEDLHAVVWTGKEDVAGVYYVRSLTDGQTWESPSRVGNINAVHCDLAGSSGQTLLMAWDSRGEILWAVSKDLGATWSEEQPLTEAESADTPAVVRFPGGFRVFWFEHQDVGSQVRSIWFSDQDLADA